MRRFTQISFILVFWLVISTCLLSSPVYGFVSSVVETKSTAYLQHTSEEGVLAVMASDLKLASIKATASESFVGSCDYDPARWDSLLYDASFQYANEALKNSPHILHPSITARGPPQNFKYDEWVKYDEGVLLFAPSSVANNRFTRTQWQVPGGRGTGQNYTVYQQNIDWTLEVDGLTNMQRAMNGNAPFIMKDGVPRKLNLHHSRQDARGSLFEVSDVTHRARKDAGGRALHPYGRNQHPDYPVDRSAFDVDRELYWIERATSAGGQ